MTGYLLDTNVVLHALGRPASLSSQARRAIQAGPNVLSVIVYWEVLLKVSKGALLVGHPRSWWLDALDILVASPLPIGPRHAEHVHDLPAIHKDP